MPQFDVALVAYIPDGARLGPLPAPLAITSAANPLNDLPALAFDYLKGAPGAQHLSGPIEVAVEVYNPETDTWFEPHNSRYLLLDWDDNPMEATGKNTYTCPGYATLMDKVTTRPPSAASRSQEVTEAKASAAAAKAAFDAACTTLKSLVGVPTKSGTIFADYEPAIVNNAVWVDTDETPIKVYRGVRPKGQAGAWTEVTTTPISAAAATAYEKKLAYDDAGAGVTRAENDKSFDREFPNANAGNIMNTLLTEAQARGDRLPGMTWDFTATTDSNGQPWAVQFEETLTLRAGQSALDVLMTLTSQGLCDWVMEGRVLHLYNSDTVLNQDRTSSQLLPGTDIKDAPNRGTYNSLTHNVLFLGEEGLTFELDSNEPITPWGKWEKSVSQGGVSRRSTGMMLGQAELEAGAGPRTEATRDLIFTDTRPLPYIHYTVGDTITTASTEGAMETLRVRQITLSRDAKGVPGGNLVLGDRFLEREVRNSRLIDGVLGGTVPKGNGALPGTPVVPTERRPEAPHDLDALAQNYLDPLGKTIGRIEATWVWDGIDTNGTPIELNAYQVQIRAERVGEPWVLARTISDMQMTLDDVAIRTDTGEVAVYQLRVRAVAYNGRASEWSEVFTIPMEDDTTPPPVPSAPEGEAVYGVITAKWDGKGAGGETMPLDFEVAEGEIAPSPTGPWTPFGGFPGAGSMAVPFMLDYGTYWLRLRSRDRSGNVSAWSAMGSATSTPLVDLPDIHDLVQELNTQIEGVRESANGYNRRIDSIEDPSVDGLERKGDTWFKWVEGAHISDPKILIGQWLWEGSSWEPVEMGHQVLASIDLGKATVGYLNGIFIEAGTIRTNALVLGDFTNMASLNPDTGTNTTAPAANRTEIVGNRAQKAAGGNDRLAFMNPVGPVPVESGDYLRVSFNASTPAGATVTPKIWVFANDDGTGATVEGTGDALALTPGGREYSIELQVPSLAAVGGGLSWYVGLDGPGSRLVSIRTIRVYKKMNATLIGPDSIDTPHLRAAAIEGQHIKSNTIETDNLVGGFADFIVMTGSTVQTLAAANRGIKMLADLNRLYAYNAEGDTTFDLSGANGDLVVGKTGAFRVTGLSGSLNIGNGKFLVDGATGDVDMSDATLNASEILGGTIVGATISTATTGRRVVMSAGFGLRGYDADNNITFEQDTSTGDFNIRGLFHQEGGYGSLTMGRALFPTGTPAVIFDRNGSSYSRPGGVQLNGDTDEFLLIQGPTIAGESLGARGRFYTNGRAGIWTAGDGSALNTRLVLDKSGDTFLGSNRGANGENVGLWLGSSGSWVLGPQDSGASGPVIYANSDWTWSVGRRDAGRLSGDGGEGWWRGGAFHVVGDFTATSKSFVIDHPVDPDRKLVHGVTESPTHGVEYWGTEVLDEDGFADINLPDYFEALTLMEGRAILVTGVGGVAWVETEIVDGTFAVRGTAGMKINWLVKATRADTWFEPEPFNWEYDTIEEDSDGSDGQL